MSSITITIRQSKQEEESVVARNTDGSIELRFSQVRFHPGDHYQVGNKPLPGGKLKSN